MFCPRCGTPHEPDAVFCERCGERLAGEQAATPDAAPSPIPPPPAGGDASARRTWLLAGGVVVVLVAVAAVLALTGVFSGDDEKASSVLVRTVTRPAPVAVPTTPAVTTETVPDAPATTTAKPAAPRSVSATVARTCGLNGVGGDCHLSVRARPASGAAELDRLDEGDALRLSCQVRGESVHSSALGASSTVWSRTTSGGYVSNVYIKGPRVKSQTITLRRC